MHIQSSLSFISLSRTAYLEKYFPVCTRVTTVSTPRQYPVFLEIAIRTSISAVVTSLLFLSFQEKYEK